MRALRLAALTLCVACGASASPADKTERHVAIRPATQAVAADPRPTGRSLLADPPRVELATSLQAADGGVIATSEEAVVTRTGEAPLTWARWLDERGRGAAVALVGERLVAAFGWGDETVLATSAGEHICIARYPRGSAQSVARGCTAARPRAVVRVGDRLALVNAVIDRPPEPTKTPPKARSGRAKTARKARGKAGRRPEYAPPRPSPKLAVDVRVRWADEDGRFDAASLPTGLRFIRPQEGMTVIDVSGRPTGIDLLWFEWRRPRPGERSRGMGRAAIVGGSLRRDGSFDDGSAAVVAEGPLQYGYIEGHMAPRLLTTERGSLYLAARATRARLAPARARDGRGRTDLARGGTGGAAAPGSSHPSAAGADSCEIAAIAPSSSLRFLPAPACAAAPWQLLDPSPPSEAANAALAALIETARPHRAPGQLDTDAERIAWGGGRGFFLGDGKLRSVASTASDAAAPLAVRDEAPAFEARRSRVAWAAHALDGEGIALIDGRVVRRSPDGAVATGPALAASGGPSTVAGDELVSLVSALDGGDVPGAARRQVARIGASWWVAHGDVVRAWPGLLAPDGLRRRAEPGATALVGGARTGMLIDLVGGTLAASAIDADGAITPLSAFASPVRFGFAASERRAGGALVAGVARGSGRAPAEVVTFSIAPDGSHGVVRTTSLRLPDGEVSLALTGLPAGGALLADAARTTVVWLDDEARPVDRRAWPDDVADAACPEGVPARRLLPTPTPGHLVEVEGYAAPGTCVIGQPRWGLDDNLHWIEATVRGVDVTAHAGTLPRPEARLANHAGTGADAPLARGHGPAAPAPACPPEMVAVGSSLCVDRFEAMLVDANTGQTLAPDFPVGNAALVNLAIGEWSTGRERVGDAHARAFPIPLPPPASFRAALPRAASRLGVRTSGYVSGVAARAACAAAGKRLCTADELLLACRGQDDTPFPYGDTWQSGACNVFRDEHPAALLHDNASIGHLDPRLNRVVAPSGPLLRATGATPTCRSRWGDDAIYDLVGNLDEWVDEPGGAFAGGFYSRSTRAGCDALITAHPPAYLDYSTGARCCADARVTLPIAAPPARGGS